MGKQELEGVSPGDRWKMYLKIKAIDKLMSKPTRNRAKPCVEFRGGLLGFLFFFFNDLRI